MHNAKTGTHQHGYTTTDVSKAGRNENDYISAAVSAPQYKEAKNDHTISAISRSPSGEAKDGHMTHGVFGNMVP